MKKTVIVIVTIAFGLVAFCAIGTAISLAFKVDPKVPVVTTTRGAGSPSPTPAGVVGSVKPKAVPTVKSSPTVGGDDIVHVGEDIPAGTYRVRTAVAGDDLCYWKKTKDSEGQDIISNDIPSGGRPQVTLKKGEWFTSSDCPTWVKK